MSHVDVLEGVLAPKVRGSAKALRQTCCFMCLRALKPVWLEGSECGRDRNKVRQARQRGSGCPSVSQALCAPGGCLGLFE